ncbi:MAG: master DNA invertase Mpi family serine-type recombinase [Lactobacillales bacterium]|jgi:DNA invertase Pin-like site-specific DNA recombinase|nr:master DNA invertase Mpi family serine-type recombinase [Lactobacillales bacterium]
MIYGYIRISTDKQTVQNQRFEIQEYTKKNDLHIDTWVEETISSRKDLKDRKLGKLLKKLKKGDILIASEISRLGRNLMQIMSILHMCMDKECQVWTIKENYRLGSDIQSKVLAFAFGLSAEIERNLISQRTREALLRLKSAGKILGRPKGSRNKSLKLSHHESRIRNLIRRGFPKTRIARLLGVSRDTMYSFCKNIFVGS